MIDIEEFSYKEDVAIDNSALDVEWLRIADLIMKYTKLEAQAERQYEQSKEQHDVVQAELDKEIREDPDAFNLQKNTEGEIRNTIQRHDRYQKSQEKVAVAKYQYNLAKAAVRSMYAKKDALENLVRLHGQQYFAGPSVPRNLNKEWEAKQKQQASNEKVKISKPKRRKRSK